MIAFLFSLVLSANAATTVDEDIKAHISKVTGAPSLVTLSFSEGKGETSFQCPAGGKYVLKVLAEKSEQTAAAYAALRDMGFLFPHPRISLFPELEALKKFCGKKFSWKPRLKNRGFHLHLQHPSEWVDGFLMENTQIARDQIWWLVRNGQNLLQLQMIDVSDQVLREKVNPLLQEARALGLKVGLSFSFSMIQQRSYNLIPFWRAFTGWGAEAALKKSLEHVLSFVDLDFLSLEMGTTEFSSTKAQRTIDWLNLSADALKEKNIQLYVKNHASTGQVSKEFGNFNFITHYAKNEVGCLPHTVSFYGLKDGRAPIYGRQDFSDMAGFLGAEAHDRNCLYFPETSYWVGMDMDIPLLLTDYLVARTNDVDWMEQNKISAGQLNFSTGQELGSWIFDWQVALLTDSRSRKNPMYALTLLGEDSKVWGPILDWQTKFFKQRQVIAMITAANLMDELTWFFKPIQERKLFSYLREHLDALRLEAGILADCLSSAPDFSKVKNQELKVMLELTKARVNHAMLLRQAIAQQTDKVSSDATLNEARALREKSLGLVQLLMKDFNRYPESWIYSERSDNPTSYAYGYLWPVSRLHFWEREEEQVRNRKTNPFFMNIYSPWRLLF